jgi:hypothetical protein
MSNPHSSDFYVLSQHAAIMLQEREIKLEWLERILQHPQLILPDSSNPELTHALGRIPEFGDRVLRVVYNHIESPWRVVTLYFDRTQRNKL